MQRRTKSYLLIVMGLDRPRSIKAKRLGDSFVRHRGRFAMQARYYTLAEAQEALPRVKELMEDIQDARRTIKRLRPEAWPAMKNASRNGGNVQAGELYRTYRVLERGVKGIMAMGIRVADVDQGLVDFLGRRNGREVYLCWRYGEEEIEQWHELTAGFAGRQPIDEQVE